MSVQEFVDRLRLELKPVYEDPLRILRFGLVGILSTAVYTAAFPVYFRLLGLDTLKSSVLAYLTAMIFSFLGHRSYTFRKRQELVRYAIRFTIMTTVTFSATILLMEYVVNALGQSYLLGIFVVDIIVPALSFFMMQFYVFLDHHQAPLAVESRDDRTDTIR